MYKSRTKRLRNISVEIAVTCNAVFLVLALLISSSKFNTITEVRCLVPLKPYDNSNEATIIITKNKVMLQIPEGLRDATLWQMEEMYHFKLSAQQHKVFKNMPIISVPIAELNTYLSAFDPQKSLLLNKGIRCDTVTNELFNWVREARKADVALNGKALMITIETEVDASNRKINEVFTILRKQKVGALNVRFGSY